MTDSRESFALRKSGRKFHHEKESRTSHHSRINEAPSEVYHNRPAANKEPRIEVRPLWPPDASCATPTAAIDGEPGRKVELVVSYHAGRKHLPIVQLKRVA